MQPFKFRSFRLFASSILLFLCGFVVFPASLSAASVAETLRVRDEQTVSRGDFIRAAVKLLNRAEDGTYAELPYLRVPKGLEKEIAAAHEWGALEVFGRDLQLARNITKGQALRVLVALAGVTGGGFVEYEDVETDSEDAQAIAIALEQGWMEPFRGNYFGVRRILYGKDALLLLRKVAGETPPPQETPTRFLRAKAPVRQSVTINLGDAFRGSPLPKSEILETIWQLINQNFIHEENIDPDEAAYRAAEAMVQSLGDPYTTFLRPAGYSQLETQIGGTVTGIGAQVEHRNGILTIVTPLRGSPAEKAGLLPNDEIIKADGLDLTGMNFSDAVDKVRGVQGSRVVLSIRRAGNIFDVEVERDVIQVPEIEIEYQEKIAIVRLLQFGKLTETQLRSDLAKVNQANPKGIILDLRNNPGGLLHAADVVVSNFVAQGTVVANIVSRDETRKEVTSDAPTIGANIPVVVLVNEGSASASEIVAGALQDAGRATVVGSKTFGKGTVQQVVRFNDNSGLKFTVAEWRTPSGRKIDGVGVQPDILVQYDTQRDEQLLKALEILR